MWRASVLWLLCLLTACEELPPLPVLPEEPPLPSDEDLLASRPYAVTAPSEYDGGTPLPLLLALHGYGNSGAGLDDQFDLTRLAQSRGFLLVLPNGAYDQRGQRAWRVAAGEKSPFDREYLRAIIRAVKVSHAVDAARVFVFGFSQGAHMAHRLGCDSADEVAAVVSLAGQAPTARADCTPARTISMLQVHGTDDEAILYEPTQRGIPSAHDTIAVWGRLNGCGALVPTTRTLDLSLVQDGDETTVERYEGCPPGIDVELWTMRGVSHWPEPRPNFMALLYGFLAVHPRR